MAIGTDSADSVDRGSRPVRGHALVSGALPGRHRRGELQPGSSKIEVVGGRNTAHQVHTVAHPSEEASSHDPGQGRTGHAGLFGLAPRDSSPLLLGQRHETAAGGARDHRPRPAANWLIHDPNSQRVDPHTTQRNVGKRQAPFHLVDASLVGSGSPPAAMDAQAPLVDPVSLRRPLARWRGSARPPRACPAPRGSERPHRPGTR